MNNKYKSQMALRDLPLGARLLVRSKKDWRNAVISRIAQESVTLSISSPTGYNYRLRRPLDSELAFDRVIPFLIIEDSEPWRENFSPYDARW